MSLVPKKRCRRGLQYPCASLQRLAVKHGHVSFMKEALAIQSAKGMPFCPSLKDCKFDRTVLDKVSIFVGTRGTLWQSSRLDPPNTCFKDIVQGNGAGQSKACAWTSWCCLRKKDLQNQTWSCLAKMTRTLADVKDCACC